MERASSWAKVSGSKGVQVYVPLNAPASYEVTQPIAKHVAEELERVYPRLILSRMARAERAGKVFIDWSQNAEHKTTVFRFTSAPSVCPEPEAPKAALKRMTKSRDDWKRYAESLEKLLPADSNHGTHP